MKPQRIQLKRTKGWRMPEGAVYVGRGSLWGNPFKIGEPSGYHFLDGGDPSPMIPAMSREDVIVFYRRMVQGMLSPEMHPHGHQWMREFKRRTHYAHPEEHLRSTLRGKALVCWCKPGEACHADVLIEIANEE